MCAGQTCGRWRGSCQCQGEMTKTRREGRKNSATEDLRELLGMICEIPAERTEDTSTVWGKLTERKQGVRPGVEEKAIRARCSALRIAADFANAVRMERCPLFRIPGGDDDRRYNVLSAKNFLEWLVSDFESRKTKRRLNKRTAAAYVEAAVREVGRAADVKILPEVSSLPEAIQHVKKAAPAEVKAPMFGAVHIYFAIKGGILPNEDDIKNVNRVGAILALWAMTMRPCEIGRPDTERDGPGLLWRHVALVDIPGIERHWLFMIYPGKKRKAVNRAARRQPTDTPLGKIMTQLFRLRTAKDREPEGNELVFKDIRKNGESGKEFKSGSIDIAQKEWRRIAEEAGGPKNIPSTPKGLRAGGFTDTTETLQEGTRAEEMVKDNIERAEGRWSNSGGGRNAQGRRTGMPAEYDRGSILAELARARAKYTTGPGTL